MKRCNECGATSPIDALFCIECGAPFAETGVTKRLTTAPMRVGYDSAPVIIGGGTVYLSHGSAGAMEVMAPYTYGGSVFVCILKVDRS